jgi:hypothetical protein
MLSSSSSSSSSSSRKRPTLRFNRNDEPMYAYYYVNDKKYNVQNRRDTDRVAMEGSWSPTWALRMSENRQENRYLCVGESTEVPGTIGLKTKVLIPSDAFIGSYIGTALTKDQFIEDEEDYLDNAYLFDVVEVARTGHGKVDGRPIKFIDGSDPSRSSMLRYANTSLRPDAFERFNVKGIQWGDSLMYMATRDIQPREEILIWYGPHSKRICDIPPINYPVPVGWQCEYQLSKKTSVKKAQNIKKKKKEKSGGPRQTAIKSSRKQQREYTKQTAIKSSRQQQQEYTKQLAIQNSRKKSKKTTKKTKKKNQQKNSKKKPKKQLAIKTSHATVAWKQHVTNQRRSKRNDDDFN